ncbi:MAG: hypothetical protein QOJ80_4863 [Mycobacterium sp.]|nr:hypothetical protein [Mycobacterium sp.]
MFGYDSLDPVFCGGCEHVERLDSLPPRRHHEDRGCGGGRQFVEHLAALAVGLGGQVRRSGGQNVEGEQRCTGTSRTSADDGRRRIGQRRCRRVNDGRPRRSSATISPSSTTSRPRPAGAPASSGNVDDASAPLRVETLTVEPAARSMPLKPSHLNSTAHSGPVGGAPRVASIGSGTRCGLLVAAMGDDDRRRWPAVSG